MIQTLQAHFSTLPALTKRIKEVDDDTHKLLEDAKSDPGPKSRYDFKRACAIVDAIEAQTLQDIP